MSQLEKLIEKLKNGTISTDELVNLLRRSGFILRQKGSHQSWVRADGKVVVLSPHGKEVKKYQIKQAKAAILGE